MPRQAASALAVKTPAALLKPLEPPTELTEFECGVWRSITATKPAEWFEDDSKELLLSYCKHVSQTRIIDGEIEKFCPESLSEDGGLQRYEKLVKLRTSVTGKIESLSRAMRLTHQSRWAPEVANNKNKSKQTQVASPWTALNET